MMCRMLRDSFVFHLLSADQARLQVEIEGQWELSDLSSAIQILSVYSIGSINERVERREEINAYKIV